MSPFHSPAAPPWLVSHGTKSTALQEVEQGLPAGTVLQIASMTNLKAWDGSGAAIGVLIRRQGWRALVLRWNATVIGEHLIARGQRGCPLDAKADLLRCGIEVQP